MQAKKHTQHNSNWLERNYHYFWYLIFAFIAIVLIGGLIAKYIFKIDDNGNIETFFVKRKGIKAKPKKKTTSKSQKKTPSKQEPKLSKSGIAYSGLGGLGVGALIRSMANASNNDLLEVPDNTNAEELDEDAVEVEENDDTSGELIKIVTTTTPTTTTRPILVKSTADNSINANQRANVIYYGDQQNNKTYTISSVEGGQEYGTKDMTQIITIPLGSTDEPFIIKQIYISKFGADNPNGNKIRVSVVDTKKNQVNFTGLNYHLSNLQIPESGFNANGMPENSEIFYNRITQLANPSDGFYLDDVKTMFGTDLVGNKLNIFTNATVEMDNTTKIIITGYKETHKWNMDLVSRLDKSTAPTLFDSGKLILIRTIALDANTSVKEGTKFRVTFTNPYSNNLFTYQGPIDGEFIYTSSVPKILLPKMLITNKPPSITIPGITVKEYGYVREVSQGDITQFRLEYNLTDLRGSINPDYVCPDIQGLINKHLDSETIVDSIEYLDKINTEKAKLSSNKNNLLTLLEQQEDIKKLELMINKIRELQSKRTHETDALAALQFTKQLDEIMRLRETLEQRIARRDRNTLDIDVIISDKAAEAAAQGVPDSRDVYKIS